MATDRVNISGPIIKPDGEYLNAMANAKTADDINRASEALRERQTGISREDVVARDLRDPATGQYVAREPAQRTNHPRGYKQTAVIAGQQFEFTGDSLENVNYQIRAAQEVANHLPSASRHDEPTEDERRQQKMYQDATLSLKFQRGEISTKEYLEQSGAVGEYLAAEGISVDAIRETIQQREAAVIEQSWAAAVERFLNGPGREWPGGSANQSILQNTLISLGLSDAEDKLGALVTAYEEMKRADTIFPYSWTAPGVQAEVEKAVKLASPEELLEAWKLSQVGASLGSAEHANQQFIESFRRKD